MANLLSLVGVLAVLIVGHFTNLSAHRLSFSYMDSPCSKPCKLRGWTKWFDRDDPTGTGDYETLPLLRTNRLNEICSSPAEIEAVTLRGLTPSEVGDEISRLDTDVGFICKNNQQRDGRCEDYKVRFSCAPKSCGREVCWTQWFNRDKPCGSGDFEDFEKIRKENPSKVCCKPRYIQAVTVDDNTPAGDTNQRFAHFSPTKGLVCVNKEQSRDECRDYMVRFACPC